MSVSAGLIKTEVKKSFEQSILLSSHRLREVSGEVHIDAVHHGKVCEVLEGSISTKRSNPR